MKYRNNIACLLFWIAAISAAAQNPEMALIKKGEYIPLYGRDSSRVEVQAFLMDTVAVTTAKFLEFVKNNPQWQKSKVKGLFADGSYLQNWPDDLHFKKETNGKQPVTNVSWFAARDYCKCQGKRLPSLDEWEYVAMSDKTTIDARKKGSYNQYILDWYERPTIKDQEIGSTYKNFWGVYDMHGLIWEWTSDFNSVLISSESRNGSSNTNLFCSAAAVGATDLMNYAAFMRYAIRSSVKGNYSLNNLGFRCAKDL